MRVSEIMSEDVQTIAGNALARDARELMRMKGIHHLVVMSGSKPKGLVSARDLGPARGAALPVETTVDAVMSAPVATVDETTPVARAANVMRGRTVGSLVITRKGRVAGIVTVADLLEMVGKGAARQPSREARPPLHYRVPHRGKSRATGVW
jgi:CBS domain-containing protein